MGKQIMTPEFRVSFPHVMTPKANMQNKLRFSLVMLFPIVTDITRLRNLAKEVAAEKWGAKIPSNLRSPFRDGNKKTYDGYKDTIIVSAQSVNRPGLINESKETIINPEEFYAGCYAIATITAFAYDVTGNRGVSFGLQNVMKVKDGEPFSGKSSPQDDFDAIPGGGESSSEETPQQEKSPFDLG